MSLVELEEVPRVDHPDKGHEEAIEKEHQCFLLDQTILFLKDVPLYETLDDNTHYSRREEQS